jgi:hypothetical protein
LLYHERRKHQQGDGKKDEEEGEFRFKTKRLSTCTKIIMKGKNRKKMVIILFDKRKIIFSKMDKFTKHST